MGLHYQLPIWVDTSRLLAITDMLTDRQMDRQTRQTDRQNSNLVSSPSFQSTLFLQRLQKLMEVIYRILNGLYPSYLNDIITVEELQHLRCRSRLFIPPFSTVRYGKKSLSYLSPVLWNSLGNDIKQCDVLTAFKKRIKLWKGPTCNCGFCAQCRISNR